MSCRACMNDDTLTLAVPMVAELLAVMQKAAVAVLALTPLRRRLERLVHLALVIAQQRLPRRLQARPHRVLLSQLAPL